MILTIILYDDVENISRFYEFILIFGNIRAQWERLKLQRSRNRCVARGGEGKRLYRLSAVPNRRRAGARVIFLTAVARNGRRSRLLSLMDKPCSWRSPPIPVALWVNYVRFFPRTTILWKTDFRFANTRLGYLTRLYLTRYLRVLAKQYISRRDTGLRTPVVSPGYVMKILFRRERICFSSPSLPLKIEKSARHVFLRD